MASQAAVPLRPAALPPQADGHPGNILVGKGGRIGLLDYGQSKQLSRDQRDQLARLIVELTK